MNDYDDTELLTHCREMQKMINSGYGWKMEGSFGRALVEMIKTGHCMLGTEPRRDYWGNFIPSREMIDAGDPGSEEHVENVMGADWLAVLKEVD